MKTSLQLRECAKGCGIPFSSDKDSEFAPVGVNGKLAHRVCVRLDCTPGFCLYCNVLIPSWPGASHAYGPFRAHRNCAEGKGVELAIDEASLMIYAITRVIDDRELRIFRGFAQFAERIVNARGWKRVLKELDNMYLLLEGINTGPGSKHAKRIAAHVKGIAHFYLVTELPSIERRKIETRIKMRKAIARRIPASLDMALS